MKNIILIIVIFISLSINAQDKGFSIGLEAGPSIVTLYGDNTTDFDKKIKISGIGAITTKFNFNKFFSLKSGIGFERKGITSYLEFTNEFGETIMEGTSTSNFDYVTIPLLAQLELGNKVKFLLNMGPYISYLLRFSSNSSFDINSSSTLDSFNRFDFGITSNIGILYKINEDLSITIEARNSLGLYNIAAYSGSIKTNSLAIITGISYSLNKE